MKAECIAPSNESPDVHSCRARMVVTKKFEDGQHHRVSESESDTPCATVEMRSEIWVVGLKRAIRVIKSAPPARPPAHFGLVRVRNVQDHRRRLSSCEL